MKLIELHILQSFPVSCLNRDDVGSPKSATFGGVQRARISSQCLKRAARTHAKQHFAELENFKGERSRLIVPQFENALKEAGVPEPRKIATEIANALSKIDAKNKSGNEVTTAVFLSPGEIKEIAAAIAVGKEIKKAIKDAKRLDAADIALFGRMIANDSSLNVEAAAMFSHALSTHKVDTDLDFFSAVDDHKEADADSENAGAGMIGTLEFNSATYYRYCALNLDLLSKNLPGLELRPIVDAFLRSVIEAIPSARQNSMNAHVRPYYVLGTYREKGQPVQLINAFECPVKPNGSGYLKASRDRLDGTGSGMSELEKLEKIWGLKTDLSAAIPDVGIDEFIQTLTAHVS
jgi:CRISPR system Cascade subunit CasC